VGALRGGGGGAVYGPSTSKVKASDSVISCKTVSRRRGLAVETLPGAAGRDNHHHFGSGLTGQINIFQHVKLAKYLFMRFELRPI